MAAGVAGTVGGLYFVLTQDLGHGPGHDEDHHAEAHETHGKNEGQDDSGDDDSQDDGKDKSQGGPKDETKSKTKNAPAEERNTEQPENPEKPGSGKPDKKKSDDASGDAPKNDESGEASPDKSDKVRTQLIMYTRFYSNLHSLTLVASPRAPTRPPASRRGCPTPIHTTARRSPSRTTRARRARVSLKLPNSRAPSPPSDLARKTRRSAARLNQTRMRKADAS